MAHIAAYLRSKVPLRTLTIDVVSEETSKVYGVVPASKGKVQRRGRSGFARNHSYDLELHDPVVQPPVAGELFWMRLFPEIAFGIEGATGGRLTRSTKVSTSFGLQLDLARSAGIDAHWLKNRIFQIDATFG